MVQSVPADFQTDPGTNFMEANAEPKPSLRAEVVAGVTTFFTMAYIVIVNPLILSGRGSEPPAETGMPFSGVLTATVVVSFTMTLLKGVYARLPFAVAPGMGLDAFFVYAVILGRGVPWPAALGAVFWRAQECGLHRRRPRHLRQARPARLPGAAHAAGSRRHRPAAEMEEPLRVPRRHLRRDARRVGVRGGAVMYALAVVSVGLLLLERFA